MENPIYLVALSLGGLLVLQFAILLFEAFRRLKHSNKIIALEEKEFKYRLAASKKEQQRRTAREHIWNGNRKFSVSAVVDECDHVRSFYLKPHDGKRLPAFKPGQFLTFNIPQPDSESRVNRCYSLSNRPGGDTYRVTIKKVENGLVSNWFHEQVDQGIILDVKAPAGGFFLDTDKSSPVVLIAGGIGITPLLSMLLEISASSPHREVWLFYSVRNQSQHILRAAIEEASLPLNRINRFICYSQPTAKCVQGKHFDIEGRVTLDLIKKQLPSNNFDFYLCGPSAMMIDLVEGLKGWGVPDKDIHREAFGPASVSQAAAPLTRESELKVEFSRSGKTFEWSGGNDETSILKIACKNHIKTIDATGCHAGNCGTCQTAIKSGEVEYVSEPGCQVESGSFLPCIAIPKGDLKIDA